MLIDRTLSSHLPTLRLSWPVIAITGPRQSGKTILAQQVAPDLRYVNLESPVERAEARRDPMRFFGEFADGAIIDEAQHVPELLSYLQVRVDADRRMGRWILTGSQHIDLSRNLSQSLAGRVFRLELLPLSHHELSGHERAPRTLAEAVLRGGYPRLYDVAMPEPHRWIDQYIADFVDRDVRQILDVRDRFAFVRFLHLCAAHTGQIVNTNRLGKDCQVDHKTIASWLGVLEACYIITLVRPHHRNFGKRIVKNPKLYFLDTGLACRLLHIMDVQQIMANPNWGALVETWCMSEILKTRMHRALASNLWFWRSSDGIELDAVIQSGNRLIPIEIKASTTPDFHDAATIRKVRALSQGDADGDIAPGFVINGGAETRPLGEDRLVSWNRIAEALSGIP